jgi:hypothetical protein
MAALLLGKEAMQVRLQILLGGCRVVRFTVRIQRNLMAC